MFDCAAAEPIMPNWAAATVMAAVPAAAEVARMLRRVGDEDSADIIILLGAKLDRRRMISPTKRMPLALFS